MEALLCSGCGKPTPVSDGYLSILDDEINEYGQSKAFQESQRPDDGEPVMLAGEVGCPLNWRWGHNECLPAGSDYHIEGRRIDTVEKALGWTLHLMEDKYWYSATNWGQMMRQFGYVEQG